VLGNAERGRLWGPLPGPMGAARRPLPPGRTGGLRAVRVVGFLGLACSRTRIFGVSASNTGDDQVFPSSLASPGAFVAWLLVWAAGGAHFVS
jgi:hypothetical protein